MIGIGILLVLVGVSDAEACKCTVTKPADGFKKSDAILLGRVLWSHSNTFSQKIDEEHTMKYGTSYAAIEFDQIVKLNGALSREEREHVLGFAKGKNVIFFEAKFFNQISCSGVNLERSLDFGDPVVVLFNSKDGFLSLGPTGNVGNCSYQNEFIIDEETIQAYKKLGGI